MFNIKSITKDEIDETAHGFMGSMDEMIKVQEECDSLIETLKKSDACKFAIQTAIEHVVAMGPDHIKCGLENSIAAFFIIACRIMDRRHRAEPEINELQRLFAIEPEEKK